MHLSRVRREQECSEWTDLLQATLIALIVTRKAERESERESRSRLDSTLVRALLLPIVDSKSKKFEWAHLGFSLCILNLINTYIAIFLRVRVNVKIIDHSWNCHFFAISNAIFLVFRSAHALNAVSDSLRSNWANVLANGSTEQYEKWLTKNGTTYF